MGIELNRRKHTRMINLTNRINRVSDAVSGVYLHNNTLYRTIRDTDIELTKSIVTNTDLMDRLHNAGLVKTSISDIQTEKSSLVLEHKLIDFNSYNYEWSPPARLDAALAVIRVAKELLKDNLCLWDGHSANVLMDFTEPKWIDFHSIMPFITTSSWYAEYKHYFFDLAGGNDSVWKIAISNMAIGIKNREDKQATATFLETIEQHLMTITPKSKETPWFSYARLDDVNLNNKQKSTLSIMEKIKPFSETFLDIGGNAGWYSQAASRLGYKVVTTDTDEACISELYLASKRSGDKILPLVADFKDCLNIRKDRYISFADRLSCDVTLSLALLHHLVFFQDCDFKFIAERLDALSKKFAIVQFITREDSYVKHWLKSRTLDWYTMDNFILEMSKYFSKYSITDSDPVGRKLILFER